LFSSSVLPPVASAQALRQAPASWLLVFESGVSGMLWSAAASVFSSVGSALGISSESSSKKGARVEPEPYGKPEERNLDDHHGQHLAFAPGHTPMGKFGHIVSQAQHTRNAESRFVAARLGGTEGFRSKRVSVSQQVGRLRKERSTLKQVIREGEDKAKEVKGHLTMMDPMIGAVKAAAMGAARYVEEMTGDFELMQHGMRWKEAMDAFTQVAFGCVPSKAPSVLTLVRELMACLANGEPRVVPHSAAVILFHPTERGLLKVYAATEASEAVTGEVFRHNAHSPVAIDAWTVIHTGEPILNNPHGLSDAHDKRSVVPLYEGEQSGRCFGVIVSGPPPVPDSFLVSLAKLAGPLLERVYKMQQINAMIQIGSEWIRKIAHADHHKVDVHWLPGEHIKHKVLGWDWQPMPYHASGDLKKFEIELRWTHEEVLGVLVVDCSDLDELDEQMVELLHTTTPLIQQCVEDIGSMHVGDPCPLASVPQMQAAFSQARLLLPIKLQSEMRRQLSQLDAQKIFAEIHHYDTVGDDTQQLFKAVLILLGHEKEAVGDWFEVRKHLVPALVRDMLALDLSDETRKLRHRWAESSRATLKIDLKKLMDKATAPVKIIIKWLQSTRLLHKVVLQLLHETDDHLEEHLSGTGTGTAKVGKIKHDRASHDVHKKKAKPHGKSKQPQTTHKLKPIGAPERIESPETHDAHKDPNDKPGPHDEHELDYDELMHLAHEGAH